MGHMVALKRRIGYVLKLARYVTILDHDQSIFLKSSAKTVENVTS